MPGNYFTVLKGFSKIMLYINSFLAYGMNGCRRYEENERNETSFNGLLK